MGRAMIRTKLTNWREVSSHVYQSLTWLIKDITFFNDIDLLPVSLLISPVDIQVFPVTLRWSTCWRRSLSPD